MVYNQIPLDEVQKVLVRNTLPKLASIKLILRIHIFTETFIPEYVFGTKDLQIDGPFHSKWLTERESFIQPEV